MVTTGRIGAGNLDSIAMMSPEDQALTIGSALISSKKLTAGINAIEEAVNSNANLLSSEFTGLFTNNDVLKLAEESKTKIDGEDI